jgi:hypothetical protein
MHPTLFLRLFELEKWIGRRGQLRIHQITLLFASNAIV